MFPSLKAGTGAARITPVAHLLLGSPKLPPCVALPYYGCLPSGTMIHIGHLIGTQV